VAQIRRAFAPNERLRAQLTPDHVRRGVNGDGGFLSHVRLCASNHRELFVLLVGAWLNANPSKQIVAPLNWYHDTADLVPETWIRL
jgi:hypothetical protein